MTQSTILSSDTVSAALQTKVNANDTELYTTRSEVVTARNGESSLDTRLDAMDVTLAASAAGSGVVVSSNDTTQGYLNGKLIVGNSTNVTVKTQADSPVTLTAADLVKIEFTENNDGGAETLSIACGLSKFTNTGATGECEYDMPAAVAGLEAFFYVTAAQTLKCDPNGTEYFRFNGTSLGAGKYISSATSGRFWHIICITDGIWDIININGPMTYED